MTSTAGVCFAASLTVLIAADQAGAPAAPTANASPPPRDPQAIVLDMLLSPDPKQQAWGAWYAGRDHMKDLVPALVSVVAQRQAGGTIEERAATEIALDALIQFRATVPSDLLTTLLETEARATHALILASHGPYGSMVTAEEDVRDDAWSEALIASMLRHDGERDSASWFAAANLLLDRRPPGFGRALVTNVRIEVAVYITETGATGIVGASGIGSAIGCRVGSNPLTGLPPWATYELSPFAHRGSVVLATGPVPVHYDRDLTNDGMRSSGTYHAGPRFEERLRYIAELMHTGPDGLPIRAHDSREVKWNGAATLTTELPRIRADVQRRFAQLLDLMVEAKVLDRGEAASIAPAIELRVEDVRDYRSVTGGEP